MNSTDKKNTMVYAYFDGACPDNPGPVGGWGYLIRDPWIENNGIISGDRITNNIAEYESLLRLLKELRTLKLSAHIHGDSDMVVKIVNKEWGVKKGVWRPHKKYPRLERLARECRSLLEQGGHKLSWIPRDENIMADQLSKDAFQ